jgi:sugar/nucleoside kinase (ribokinase family)
MKLGIVGTFVWDTIWTLEDVRAGRPFETWGGLAYSLAGAAAARPEGWEIVPIVKVGADLADEAQRFMASLPGVAPGQGVMVVEEPTNRVELTYTDEVRRGERLTGGVSAWEWEELAPRLEGLDALYVNFLSGFEMGLETAMRVRTSFPGPLYADLHSLFLGCPGAGVRARRSLPDWERWAACFHALQLNEDELAMLPGDPMLPAGMNAAGLLEQGPGLVVVTQGGEGATVVSNPNFPDDPLQWPAWRSDRPVSRASSIPPDQGTRPGDPTGAGDVWGAAFICSLLAGHSLEEAVRRAHRFAGAKMGVRGATHLYEHLAASVPPGEPELPPKPPEQGRHLRLI